MRNQTNGHQRLEGHEPTLRFRAARFLRGVVATLPQQAQQVQVVGGNAAREIERDQSAELIRLINRIQELTRRLRLDFPSALQLVSSMRLDDLTRETIAGNKPDYKIEWVNATAAGDTEVVERVEGKKIRVVAFTIVNAGIPIPVVHFRSNTRPITSDKLFSTQGGGMVASFSRGFWFETAFGEELNINLSVAGTIGVDVTYVEAEE